MQVYYSLTVTDRDGREHVTSVSKLCSAMSDMMTEAAMGAKVITVNLHSTDRDNPEAFWTWTQGEVQP